MCQFNSKRTLISLAVMLAMFFIGLCATQLWKIERDWTELSKPKTVVTPVSAPRLSQIAETAPKATACDWIKDSKLVKDSKWSPATAKRTVDAGVLDSNVCHVGMSTDDGSPLILSAVQIPDDFPAEPIVKVIIDSNGFVREARVIKSYDPIPDNVLIKEALKIRMQPMKLGGDPTPVNGVLSSRFFDMVVRNIRE